MKKVLSLIGAVAMLLTTSAKAEGMWEGIASTVTEFLKNNPTNVFDVTGYGLYNATKTEPDVKKSWGGGARIGYWINPSVGAALDTSYTDSSWTFASLALKGRLTIEIGKYGSIAPYVYAGPGWNISGKDNGATQSIVAVAGSGATLHINKLPWFDLIGEWRHITTENNQDQVVFGVTRKF